MSAWRGVAIEKIPKQRFLIEQSESVGMLWVELWGIFVQAHSDPTDEEIIRGVYEFAKWTITESGDTGIATSTCCHFDEHLPTESVVKALMPRYVSRQEILNLAEVFKYHLTADEHRDFLQEFS